jgi:hypothetical protein
MKRPTGPRKRLRIIVLDQFEELFTTYPERWKDRERFIEQLAEALEGDRTLRVMLALREEYVGRLKRFAELFPSGLRQWFHLERLREGPALAAVEGPAKAAGRPYQPGVAETIVQRLLPIRVRSEDGTVTEISGEFVEPVHLQIVCRRIWDNLAAATQEITAAHVEAHGDVVVALREYYETQVAIVAEETGISARKLRRWFERELVGDDGRRTRVFEKDGRVAGQLLHVAERFRALYMLRSESQGDAVWFELAHDRLVAPVQSAEARHRRRILPMQVSAAVLLLALGFGGGAVVYQRRIQDKTRRISVRAEAGAATPGAYLAPAAPADNEFITIAVVVHVVYNTPEQNVSDAQIASQLMVLNEDFSAQNGDLKKVPDVFKSAVGNARIRFVLATQDADGRPTNGITRRRTSVTGFGTDDRMKSESRGGTSPWATQRYLNIWVVPLDNSLLGYSQFPDGPEATDGIVVHYRAFGTGGTALAPFDGGRTTTHNVGEYLNLRHIWGDTPDCTGSDNVEDTPNAEGPNFGTPTFPLVTCENGPNGDMFMNFMDYVDDKAMFMFTSGQVARMRETLASLRRGLWAR